MIILILFPPVVPVTGEAVVGTEVPRVEACKVTALSVFVLVLLIVPEIVLIPSDKPAGANLLTLLGLLFAV